MSMEEREQEGVLGRIWRLVWCPGMLNVDSLLCAEQASFRSEEKKFPSRPAMWLVREFRGDASTTTESGSRADDSDIAAAESQLAGTRYRRLVGGRDGEVLAMWTDGG
ncbi:hypothetical protein Dda_2876 [Drechslerella dactyloides]|uniref:Uncharacterized protein n=1 Tax=Drechslerella dactyloides TaxID=74499 RepID=A0AAD6NKZ3_DREDA|nr:hypothetical protein Dda_2876 [Drechslerella dactyloides]